MPVDPDDVLPIWQLGDRHGLSGPTSLLIQAAIDQGIAEAAIADAIQFVRERATIRRNYTTVALTPGIVKEQQDMPLSFASSYFFYGRAPCFHFMQANNLSANRLLSASRCVPILAR
ncbi:hypothetical protein J2793_006845 [Paraburkholderia caledonica]|uniref:Uncharacterized protein n=1 Tax=Paraburkholderia caledonica TaxID=134536 RepID=A0AB73IMX8_9BURK|nr:hypothetical protein [Paraburkholderia caledonica]